MAAVRARGTSKIDFDAPRRERPPSPASGDRWGGVMMVGGDMLGRRGFLLYGHGEDGDGVGGCRRHGCFVLSRYSRSYNDTFPKTFFF